MVKILYDKDLHTLLDMRVAINAVEEFFRAASDGLVVSPPRHSVEAGDGGLTFTIGAELERTKTIGFRVYDTFPHQVNTDTDQVVCVYSTVDGSLKGIVIGSLIGAIRTAAIGGLALRYLAPQAIEEVVVVGAGFHAYYQLQALLAEKRVGNITVTSRTTQSAEKFINTCSAEQQSNMNVADSIESAVRTADVVLCCTSSRTPVVQTEWLKENVYISSIGPKSRSQHELPIDIVEGAATVCTDAPAQLAAHRDRHFLPNHDLIIPLESVVTQREVSTFGRNIFLSSGRAGTEVVVANAALSASE